MPAAEAASDLSSWFCQLIGVLRRLGENRGAMDFYNAYSQGFVRVAACTHHAAIGDPGGQRRLGVAAGPRSATTTVSRWPSSRS